MLKEDDLVGGFTIYRQEIRPFTDKQIELVKDFAAQAVIAIENARLLAELRESLQEQTATAEVLQVISSSPGDLQPVFGAMLEKAVRICDASFGEIFSVDDGNIRLVAFHNTPVSFVEAIKQLATPSRSPTSFGKRLMVTKSAIQIADLEADEDYIERNPTVVAAVELGRVRTVLAVPMLKEDALIGELVLNRQEVRPFTEKQIALVLNFASQAVIAIENARLLNELRESLQEQTAASQVLQIISSSPGELQPVFEAMLENATRICEAKFGVLYLYDNAGFKPAALSDAPPVYGDFVWSRGQFFPQTGNGLDRLLHTKTVVHSIDEGAEPVPTNSARLAGARSQVLVPMLKEANLAGAIAIYRQEVRPFSDKQIELVKNFAAQAVIAIENARLLNELRQRTADLTESLEQQTATSEVLQVVSSSPGDLEPVFATMLEKAARICDATFGNIFRWDGSALHLAGTHNTPPALAEARRRSPVRHNPKDPFLVQVLGAKTVHVADLAAEPIYTQERDPTFVAGVELGGIRTILLVPMLKEGELIGVFSLYRQEVRPFTDKQIELVKNFAAQAVIAIENARLLSELRESLQEQTATSEVLQVVSSSPGDLEPVFAAMLEKAVRICEAKFGNIYRWDGSAMRLVAAHNTPPAFAEARRRSALLSGPKTAMGRMVATNAVVHVIDIAADEAYFERDASYVEAVELAGVRTLLVVPLLKDNGLMGAFTVYRQEVRPFTDKQIALVTNFAAQAVIAIENARLLQELRDRTEEVEKLNQRLEQRVADQVGEIERMGRLRRFLPPQVADLIVASGTERQLESHRREITALFCDRRGFTGFTESADAEDVMALLRDYHAAIGEIIIKYSGTLERYAGDGVMVIFNDPVPIENPALQAVLMALEMRVAIGTLTEKWRQLGHEIGFGIGIAHGYATLGTIGFEGRFDYAAIGTVSNVASRLCDEAKPGQILISPRVLMAVKDAISVEPVGEFELKGIRRPIAAYNVLATSAQTH
jgi:GAF domain-containing protein